MHDHLAHPGLPPGPSRWPLLNLYRWASDTRGFLQEGQREFGDVFTARDDGLWVVKEESKHFGTTVVFDGSEGAGHGPDGGRGVARIPDSLLDSAVEAAEECPGECIMIEPYDQAAIDSRGV